MRIRILTLNVGLLQFLWGKVQWSPFVEERAAVLPFELLKLNADVVALQEIYVERHRRRLINCLRDHYPFVGYQRQRAFGGLENGLMVLSKWPISASLNAFRIAPIDERFFDKKGVLICQVETPGIGTWSLLNTHTTAGGLRLHPESKKADVFRWRQIEQLIDLAAGEVGLTVV